MKSVVQSDEQTCFLCGRNANADYFGLDTHHVYGGQNRKKSDAYGLTVRLCHHTCHLHGVHADAGLARQLKANVQQIAMNHYGWSVDDFRRIFGKNYL